MSNAPKASRLTSIDALRGFDMFWIIGGDRLFRALAKWADMPGSSVVSEQLDHVEWEGFRFYDLIFPLFLFLVGVVIPYSFASVALHVQSRGGLYWRIFKRTALLLTIAFLYNGILQFNWADLRWAGVLQRIALCYAVAALITMHTGPRGQLLSLVLILVGYWLLFLVVPVADGADVSQRYSKEYNLSGVIDRQVLPGKILDKYYGYGDNEGLLSTIPAIATCLMGVLAGHWLRSPRGPWTRAAGLAFAGVIALALGHAWGMTFPIIKNIWTSSFVLVAGGWSLLLLSVFYAVIDVGGFKRWAFFFVVIGANAITIYMAQRVFDFEKVAVFFTGGIVKLVGTFGPVLAAMAALAVKWLFLLYLYRNKIFLRA